MGEGSGTTEARGLNRLTYFFCIVGFFAGIVAFIAILDAASGSTFRWLVLLMAVAILIGWMYPMIKRIQNTGYSGWWSLLTMIPLFNLLFLMCCMALPPNYRSHGKLDNASYYIVGGYIVYWIAVIYAATYMPSG